MADPTTPVLNDRITALFEQRPGEELDVGTIWTALGSTDQRPTLVTSLSVLSRKGVIVRTRNGVYRLASEAERTKAAATRVSSARSAERAEQGEPAPKAPKATAPAARSEGRSGTAMRVVAPLRDGRILLEGGDGTLWAATQLVEGRR